MTPLRRAAALAVPLLLASASAAPAAERFFTVTPDNELLGFQSDKPSAILSAVPLAGLGLGEEVVGLDQRPDSTTLFALTNVGRLYRVSPASGQAFAVRPDPFGPALGTEAIGFDFNPSADRIRIHTDTNQNLRVNPADASLVSRDPDLTYAPGDPNAGSDPDVVATAYTNNLPGAPTTTLYGIDSSRRTLVRQDPPNGGALATVAPLTLGGAPVKQVVGPVSFDIAASGVAYVSFRFGGERAATLFTLDLASGRLRPIAPVGPILPQVPTQGLAAVGRTPDDTASPDVVIAAPAAQRLANVVTRGLRFELSCSEACLTQASLRVRDRVVARGVVTLNRAGKGSLRLLLTPSARRAIVRSQYRRVTLQARVTDFAGNTRRQSENVTLTP